MRQKLNENPVYQAAAIGVLALLVGLMLMMRMGGGEEPAPAPAPTPSTGTATTVVGGTAAPTDPAAAAATDSAAAATSTSTTAPAGVPSEFKAGPGLPAEVVAAYDGGQAVAVLVVSKDGIDDRDLEATVRALSQSDVAVFVTDVKDVAEYSRITQGVDLNRTPALIVIRPKRLTEGPMPSAEIAYGFRGPDSVQQAFKDALYDGPSNLPPSP